MDPVTLLFDSSGGLGDHAEVADALFQRPRLRLPVRIADDTPRLVEPLPHDRTLGFPGFAKLGAKSWRDGGGLMIIPAEVPLAATIGAMLGCLSRAQSGYLRRVRQSRSVIDLVIFRYVDFSDISEARWMWRDGVARRTSRCCRGRSGELAAANDPAALRLFERLARVLPASAAVDLATEPDGRLSVLDVNPV